LKINDLKRYSASCNSIPRSGESFPAYGNRSALPRIFAHAAESLRAARNRRACGESFPAYCEVIARNRASFLCKRILSALRDVTARGEKQESAGVS
jgi:hypothetical protein